MNIIVAVDKNWGIGRDGELLISIPKDKKLFREETMGRVLIMGRKTFESLPVKRPLYGRVNIVLSENQDLKIKGAVVVHNKRACLDYISKMGYKDEDVFVIGGESVYREFFEYCDTAHVTYIAYAYEADRYMPNLDRDVDWKLVLETDEETYFDIEYCFRMYKKNRI